MDNESPKTLNLYFSDNYINILDYKNPYSNFFNRIENLIENNNEFYSKILFELSGKFPEFRPYKKKEDITEKERENLN